jgi:hypothetical protein
LHIFLCAVLAFSFALLALRNRFASRAPFCTLGGLSRLTLASGSGQPGALRVQAVRGLHLGVRVSLGNTVPKYLLELFAGLASLASSLAMNTFIKHDVVEDWKLQYTPARYGVAQHFKILVLRGESMAGKLSFAKSLFGE